MHTLALAIGLSAIGSAAGLIVASSMLLFSDGARVRLVSWLVSYAVGTLLGASLLHLVPEALEGATPRAAIGALLAGILTFFVLEKLVIWRHCHEEGGCAAHDSAASLVLAGDAFHTFIDGAIIGAAVLTSIPLGISTAIAAATHEIPQEVGDFAVLLNAGYSRRKAILLNLLSATAGIAGTLVVFFTIGQLPGLLPLMIAFAAGGFLYVAMSDLIPDLHRNPRDPNPIRQTLMIAAGIVTMLLV
ncbi:MAG TPA: ZIP family metal transporter [Vicinamibacterales bacterium]